MRRPLLLGILILGSISLQGMEGGNPPAYEVSPYVVTLLQQFQNASEPERAALCQEYSELLQGLFAVNPETGRSQAEDLLGQVQQDLVPVIQQMRLRAPVPAAPAVPLIYDMDEGRPIVPLNHRNNYDPVGPYINHARVRFSSQDALQEMLEVVYVFGRALLGEVFSGRMLSTRPRSRPQEIGGPEIPLLGNGNIGPVPPPHPPGDGNPGDPPPNPAPVPHPIPVPQAPQPVQVENSHPQVKKAGYFTTKNALIAGGFFVLGMLIQKYFFQESSNAKKEVPAVQADA